MISKRKRIIIFAAIFTVLLLIAGGTGFFIQQMLGEPKTKPVPTETPTPSPTAIAPERPEGDGYDLAELADTEQAEAGYLSSLTNFVNDEDLGNLDAAFFALAANTVDRYVEQSVANPYFVADYWKTEDNYRVDSLQTYLTPLMSESEAEEFVAAATSEEEATIREYYNGLLHLYAPETQALPLCADTWDPDACFYQPYEYTDATFAPVDGRDDQIAVSVTVKTYPVYQKPGALDGNSVYVDRTYTLDFLLQLTKQETSGGAEETPILEVADVAGSLVIGQATDYIIAETE